MSLPWRFAKFSLQAPLDFGSLAPCENGWHFWCCVSLLLIACVLRIKSGSWWIVCSGRKCHCRTAIRRRSSQPMAHRLTKRQALARFTSRKNPVPNSFRKHAKFRRYNSIPSLSTAVAPRERIYRNRRSEIHELLIQRKQHAVPAMPFNPTKRYPAGLTQRTDLFWIRAKAKSRSTGKTRRSRSTKCVSC